MNREGFFGSIGRPFFQKHFFGRVNLLKVLLMSFVEELKLSNFQSYFHSNIPPFFLSFVFLLNTLFSLSFFFFLVQALSISLENEYKKINNNKQYFWHLSNLQSYQNVGFLSIYLMASGLGRSFVQNSNSTLLEWRNLIRSLSYLAIFLWMTYTALANHVQPTSRRLVAPPYWPNLYEYLFSPNFTLLLCRIFWLWLLLSS